MCLRCLLETLHSKKNPRTEDRGFLCFIYGASGRRRGCPRRPPTPPYERFRIRRFLICVCIINQQCLTSYKHPALPHDFRSLLPAFRPSCEASAQNVQKSGLALHIRFSPSLWWLGQLLWRLLTSVGPSMYLTMHLAQGRPTDLPG